MKAKQSKAQYTLKLKQEAIRLVKSGQSVVLLICCSQWRIPVSALEHAVLNMALFQSSMVGFTGISTVCIDRRRFPCKPWRKTW